MSDGLEVRPEDLRRGAGLLRDDAGRCRAALARSAAGATAAAGAAGDGPLEDAATTLAGAVDTLLRAVTSSITGAADALDAASTRYRATDEQTAAGLDGGPPISLPGVAPPR
ncbi:type VII secretion target [Actinomycetospora sp. C-140]